MAGARHGAFAAGLAALKLRSNLSYQKLAHELDRPVSTIHGWVTGRHLPYARDNGDFEHLLRLLGATETTGWMARLSRLRTFGDEGEFDNPYRGLESFTEAESDLFHGREGLTRQLVTRVDSGLAGDDPCPLMVIGASGSGKTSLIRAGLSANLSAKPDCAVHYLTPGNEPVAALTNAVRAPEPSRSATGRHVVIVDQFEELFSEANSRLVDDFVQLLDEVHHRPRTALVVGLRADFFHRASAIPFLLGGLQRNQIVVGPMSTDEVTDCIVLPARQSGLAVAPDLLAELITEFASQVDTGGSAEALPLLSHVLYLLADTSHGNELTLDRYREIGGLASALQRSADEVLDFLGDEHEAACRFLFTRLVELGVDSLPTRRTVDIDALDETACQTDLGRVIDEFAGHRLLTIDVDTVTISHEALLSAWPRLIKWIGEERDTLLTVRRVGTAARSWEETGREPEALLRGSQLDAAAALLTSPTAATRLSPVERSFLHASQAARDQRLMENAGVLSRQLSAQAVALQGIDPSLSAQVALIANQTASTVESRSVLLGATSPLPGARFLGGPGPTALAVSADASRAAFSNSVVGSITILDSADGVYQRTRELRVADPETDVYALALSPDGRMLAAGGTDRTVTLVDLGDGGSTTCLDGSSEVFDGPVRSLLFDTRGRHLFAAGTGSGVKRWDVGGAGDAGVPGGVSFDGLIPADGTTLAVAVDGWGQILATANRDGTIALWELHDPSAPRWQETAVNEGPAAAVALSSDGGTLVAGYHSGRVRVWSVESRGALVEIPLDSAPFASWVNWVELSPDGSVLAAASSDGNARVWDTRVWKDLRLDLRHPTVVTCVRCTSANSLVTSAEDGTIRVWALPEMASSSSGATIWSLSFDARGERLASSSRTRAALWSIDRHETPTVDRTIRPPGDAPIFSGASCISPGGNLLVVGTRHGAVLARRIDRPDAEPTVLHGLTSLVENIAMSVDGSMLCGVDHDGNVQIWTVDDDRHVSPAATVKVEAPAMCPAFGIDSTTLAVASESGDVTLFDVTRPHAPGTIATIGTGDSFALSVAFHPSLSLLAVANADRSVSLWDCTDSAEPVLVRRLTGPGGNVMTVSFSATGAMLAAGVTDGKVWIWDTSDPEDPVLHAVIQSRELGVYSLAFSPGGSRLMGAGPRQRVFSWIVDETAAAAAICAAVGDTITPEEWSHLVPALPYRNICRVESWPHRAVSCSDTTEYHANRG